jgi:molybdopterin converting factor subunit 1
MQVRLKCFAWAREVTGQEEIEIVCPEDATVGDLREKLAEKYPVFAERMESIAVSVNQEFSGDGVRIAPGDEVALIPPISGGCA